VVAVIAPTTSQMSKVWWIWIDLVLGVHLDRVVIALLWLISGIHLSNVEDLVEVSDHGL
jgi:hypothetical protein